MEEKPLQVQDIYGKCQWSRTKTSKQEFPAGIFCFMDHVIVCIDINEKKNNSVRKKPWNL